MVISFELHPDWTDENIKKESRSIGITFGKDSHFHYNGVTGIYVIQNRMLTIEIIEKPSSITKKKINDQLLVIARKLATPRNNRKDS